MGQQLGLGMGAVVYRERMAWQGYHGVDLQATLDLKTPQPIRQVSVRFLQDVSVGIFLPTFVDVALSSDGRNFEPPVTLKPDVSEREAGPLIETLAAELDPRPARFIRVQARNLGLIPDWHKARREKAWLFVDEILVDPSASPGPSEIPGPARSGVKRRAPRIWTTPIPRVMDGSAPLLAVVCAWRAIPVPGYRERALGGQWANYDDVSG